jgi:acetyl-CoA carboxylase biotin carboxylase subunit
MKRLLIANRGEIARRVIRTARRMGIETVAIYSDVDTPALHVRDADLAWRIKGLTPRETYLDVDKVMEAIKETGADAVHPGYGFLSENAAFAERCRQDGIVFVGPSPEAIDHLGSKTNARRLAIDSGVPVMPGTTAAITSLEEARTTAEEIGYPVLLKAAAGGGGKGMRVVESPDRLEESLRGARGEAMSAFNSDEIFVEKYILRPRHVEIQIVADQAGNVVVLGERECSVQRRHQKVIEESPSPAVSEQLRQQMFASAEQLVKAAGYSNAGTLEFLLDEAGNYYFLEVNTRLQVEHPVTEMCTGIDIVELQLKVARGESLPIRTKDVERRGHAIECRISAEDVYGNFMPSIGTVREVSEPDGEHVRIDSALYDGMPVSLYYDPMLAKAIVWSESRDGAIERMIDVLNRYHIAGVSTTIPFCRFVLRNPEFRAGHYTTNFVNEHWNETDHRIDSQLVQLAAAAAVTATERIEDRFTHGASAR